MKGIGSQDWDAMIEKVIADMSVEYEKRMDEFYNSFKDIFSI